MYLRHGSPNSEYKAQYRSLSFNLKNNSDLLGSICTGAITGSQLVQMPSEEMASNEVREQHNKIRAYYAEACKVRQHLLRSLHC
jgi:hypothetical protein